MKKAFLVAVVIMTANVSFGQSFLTDFTSALRQEETSTILLMPILAPKAFLGIMAEPSWDLKLPINFWYIKNFYSQHKGQKLKTTCSAQKKI